ncbi:MAG TPA: hypothetical protein VI306_08625 [Pyrinomonadaceae bacterium]
MTLESAPPENFEILMSWLGPDREKAGAKYEQIRQNLLDYFRRRNVSDPITLTDEVIARVTRKARNVAKDFVGDPSAYFLAVARRVLAEWWRRPIETELSDDLSIFQDPHIEGQKELLFQSLERCWARLSAADRDILCRYCVEAPPMKLAQSREILAGELNVSLNALRVMAHRLKKRVKSCIERLIGNKS